MYINLQLPDNAYQRLIANGTRLRGTIGLTSPTEGNFNEHARSTPHGRATVTQKHARLSLVISLDEADILPAQAIETESQQASAFVDRVFGGGWE